MNSVSVQSPVNVSVPIQSIVLAIGGIVAAAALAEYVIRRLTAFNGQDWENAILSAMRNANISNSPDQLRQFLIVMRPENYGEHFVQELRSWLQTPEGKFSQWLAERNRNASTEFHPTASDDDDSRGDGC